MQTYFDEHTVCDIGEEMLHIHRLRYTPIFTGGGCLLRGGGRNFRRRLTIQHTRAIIPARTKRPPNIPPMIGLVGTANKTSRQLNLTSDKGKILDITFCSS